MSNPESTNDPGVVFLSRTIFFLRIFLGITFLHYGITKLLGGQFFYGNWTFDKRTVDGGYLVFAFFGYSPVYARFLGICEALPATLLFFRKSATLGAAMLFAVGLNITVMDFCYGGMLHTVKYFALTFTMMLSFLLLCDSYRLRLAFWPSDAQVKSAPANRISSAVDLAQMPTSLAGRLLFAFGTAVFLIFMAIQVVIEVTPGPQAVAAECLLQQGWQNENLRLVRMHSLAGSGRYRNTTLVLDYEINATNPPKVIHVQESRRALLFPWRVEKVTEETR